VNVASGQSVSNAVFGGDSPFSWGYYMPYITGYYYLLIYADAFDTFAEADESNNFAYFTQDNGDPIYILNGVMQNAPTKKILVNKSIPVKGQNYDFETVRKGNNLNTYTTSEIQKGSVIISANKSFEQWRDIFADSVLAAAIIDPIAHYSTIFKINGNSYRARNLKKGGGKYKA